jgi:phytoene synthase
MPRREFDAAGICNPELRASYDACRRLNAAHGKTYYLATWLLPPAKRPYVHALYGFARYADEIVDDLASTLTVAAKAEQLQRWGDRFLADLDTGRPSADPICRAVVDTVRRWDIPVRHFEDFLTSMRMDLSVTGYDTFADLMNYMHGSAAVIGFEMTPILGPLSPAAYGYAAELGVAFQLTNFLRDIGEDLRRGRLYLPAEHLEQFGVTRADLAAGTGSDGVRDLLAYEVAATRARYRRAEPGIDLIQPTSRDCVRTAFTLYRDILAEVERAGYRVLDRRVRVGPARRAAVAVPGLWRAGRARRFARRPSHTHQISVWATREKPKSRSSTGA